MQLPTTNTTHQYNNIFTMRQRQVSAQHQQAPQNLEITKFDYEVAQYMRKHLPSKQAMFVGIKKVDYFIGSKAIDLLLESKWNKDYFTSREQVVSFLNDLLLKKFYHRAKKITKLDGTKKKFKLDMHDMQLFVDSNEPFVWIYEPTSIKAWILCLAIVFGVIAVCLFPLWPPLIRQWVYYICVAGLIFLSSILALALIRQLIFVIIWAVSFGKLHFWLLPNLTEDVGFFESFWPLYDYEMR